MIRVIGNFQFRAPKNNSVKAFVQWLSKFEGCQFTSEDWKHFRNKVIERKVYYNREVKYGGYMIGVHFSLGQICVSCGNGNGVPASQLVLDSKGGVDVMYLNDPQLSRSVIISEVK